MEKKDDEFMLRPLGDIHFGYLGHDRQKFLKDFDWVKDTPNAFTIGMGDYFENNSLQGRGAGLNKHFDQQAVYKGNYPTVEHEMAEFLPLWKKLCVASKIFPQTKCVGMLVGNHEDRTNSLKGDGFHLRVCKPLGAEYLGDFAFVELLFKHAGKPLARWILCVAHGNFGGKKHGTVFTAAQNRFSAYNFDIAMFGHTHFSGNFKYKVGRVEVLGEAPAYVEDDRYIVNTGSFVHSHLEDVDLYTDKEFGSLR
ncbi:MAG: metallophosphoesterase, partial [Tepidisphaeraceae bacterium]